MHNKKYLTAVRKQRKSICRTKKAILYLMATRSRWSTTERKNFRRQCLNSLTSVQVDHSIMWPTDHYWRELPMGHNKGCLCVFCSSWKLNNQSGWGRREWRMRKRTCSKGLWMRIYWSSGDCKPVNDQSCTCTWAETMQTLLKKKKHAKDITIMEIFNDGHRSVA